MKRLQFSLGPVQSFVSQARRTRDLWAGSFLLSYLSGQAMDATIRHQGKIVFPIVTDGSGHISDPLLEAIHHNKLPGPRIGTLPNRFAAEIPGDFQPLWCVEAVQRSWAMIAEAVWTHFVAPAAHLGSQTRAIWDRQIAHFWEVQWVLGEDPDLLDRRKNWRSHVYPGEAGRKCRMMPQWQEISGHGSDPRKRDAFWKAIRTKTDRLDLEDGEELSAMALVKRLFPRVANHAIGWPVQVSYRSTVDFAVQPWVREQCRVNADLCVKFAETAKPFHTRKSLPPSLEAIGNTQPALKGFLQVDANALNRHTLLNEALWEPNTAPLRASLAEQLRAFRSYPDTYYAVLLMDGDHLGRLLRQRDVRDVSRALAHFTEGVPAIVSRHDGELIYAGGDDVLALFTVVDAVTAAQALHDLYQAVIQDMGTVSAAIVYAHAHAPLTEVIHHAHHVLDHIAKNRNGRNSLALSVWNSSGPDTTWVTRWDYLADTQGHHLNCLVQRVGSQMSSQFLFKIRDLESKLSAMPDDDLWEHLMTYELNQTRHDTVHAEDKTPAQIISREIVQLSHGTQRPDPPGSVSPYQDLLYVIHFLAKRERSHV